MSLGEYGKKLGGALGTLLQQRNTPPIDEDRGIDAVATQVPSNNPGSYTLPQEGEHVSSSFANLLSSVPLDATSGFTDVTTGQQAGRKVPTEILVQIFDWHLDNRHPPSRSLALVCKYWRELILDSPILWNNLCAHFCEEDEAVAAIARTRRRIELSRYAPLNITLSTTKYTTKCKRQDVLDLVASTGVERWRTLQLEHHASLADFRRFNVIFASGQFSSLRVLRLSYNAPDDPFSPIGRLLVQSKPVLKEIYAHGYVPGIYGDPQLFRNCKIVSGRASLLLKLHDLAALQDLRLKGLLEFRDIPAFLLPESVTFDALFRDSISNLQRVNIRYLEVRNWQQTTITAIDLPNLETLILHNGSITDILQISAPKVQVLKLGGSWPSRHLRKDVLSGAELITASFTQTPSVVLMSPTTLSIYVDTKSSIDFLILILDTWSQLEHVTLKFHELTPKGAFTNRIIDPTNPLCPRLVDLSLDSSNHLFKISIPEWEDLAREMFKLRRKLPLQTIYWRWEERSFGTVPWHTMKKETYL